jgi:hypothetical protein
MSTKSTNLPTFYPSIFDCENCNFKCSKKRDYERHLLTRKHIKSTGVNVLSTETPKKPCDVFMCEKCEKVYKERSGLWRHNKKCNVMLEPKKSNTKEPESEILCKLIEQNMELVTQNQEFKQMMVEQNKQNAELQKQLLDLAKETKITTINNNTNNNKFNMNFFLNEKCKDALNIMDFVSSLQLQLQDLEETGRLGYIQGISRIFINGLKELDIHKRPIHCSDVKRETLYIKDNDSWEKEDADKKKIKGAIKYVSLKNAKQINEWTKEHKGYNDSANKNSDKYLKLIMEANGGEPEEINKIIKNISTNVIIDKDKV